MFVRKRQKLFIGAKSSTVPENIHKMKFRTSKELKNMILSIYFAILTFFKFLFNFLKHFRVDRYENLLIFFFLWKAIKIAGLAQNNWVGRVSGNTGIF